MMDAGIVTVCNLINTAAEGDMPAYQLVEVSKAYFANRTVSYRRLYAAKGANEEIDLLIRVWCDPTLHRGQYAVLSMSVNDGQYEIQAVQHTVDEDNLKVSDITLKKVDHLYDVLTGEIEEGTGCAANYGD